MQARQSFALHMLSKLEKQEDRCLIFGKEGRQGLTFKGGVAAISKSITKGPSVSQRTFAYLKSRCTSCLACKAEALCKQARMTCNAKIGEVVPDHIFWQQVLEAYRHVYVQQSTNTAVSITLAWVLVAGYPTLQTSSTVKLYG